MHQNQLMTNQQIVQAFDELRMTPAQIADSFKLDELSVKSILIQSSKMYKDMMDAQINYNLTDKEALEAKETIVRLMRHSNDEHLQFKVAKYILDDKKGRLDIGKNLSSFRMDVNVFNQYLVDAREALNNPSKGALPEKLKELVDV